MNKEKSATQVGRRWLSPLSGLAMLGIAVSLASPCAFAAYEVVAVANGGTIDGTVTLSGAHAGSTITTTKNQDY